MSTPSPAPRSSALSNWLLAAWMALIVLLGLTSLRPPDIVLASAPQGQFSAERAMAHLQIIGQLPHPLGSTEHAHVRDYLLHQLTALGLHPQIQATTVVRKLLRQGYRAVHVENVLARLPGDSTGPALLLAAHYDSVPTGPGASDDGAAVAALLETARALKAGPPLRNDIIFLFTDGEEAGLFGAKAFVEGHPWAKRVAVALNFEARGTGGPSLMFETSSGNDRLIGELARAVPHPCASSLFYAVYKRLPNDTDFTLFRQAGMAGMNFAYIENLGYYHSARDDLLHIDERSLQHHGESMLALARRLGNRSLAEMQAEDAVYFNPGGPVLLVYSQVWVWPLAFLAAAGFVIIVGYGLRVGRLTTRGVRLGFLAILLALALTVLILIGWGVVRTHLSSGSYWMLYSGWPVPAGVAIFALAVGTVILSIAGSRLGSDHIVAGGLIWWLLPAWCMAALLPGGAYLFVWPLIGALISYGITLRFPQMSHGWRYVALGLGAVPALLLLPSTLYQLYTALSTVALTLIGGLVVLITGLLALQIEALLAPARTSKLVWIAALGSILLVVCGLKPPADADRPTVNSIFYGLDADTDKAVWASADPIPDTWTEQFLGESPDAGPLPLLLPNVPGRFLYHDTAALSLAAPEAKLLQDVTQNGVRTLRLRIRSARHAPCIEVALGADTGVLSAAVDGKQMETPMPGEPERSLFLMAVPDKGMEVELRIRATKPLNMRLIDRSYGLPQIPGESYRPRPPDMMAWPTGYWFADTTLVSKDYTF